MYSTFIAIIVRMLDIIIFSRLHFSFRCRCRRRHHRLFSIRFSFFSFSRLSLRICIHFLRSNVCMYVCEWARCARTSASLSGFFLNIDIDHNHKCITYKRCRHLKYELRISFQHRIDTHCISLSSLCLSPSLPFPLTHSLTLTWIAPWNVGIESTSLRINYRLATIRANRRNCFNTFSMEIFFLGILKNAEIFSMHTHKMPIVHNHKYSELLFLAAATAIRIRFEHEKYVSYGMFRVVH